jgi:hypothetical protein
VLKASPASKKQRPHRQNEFSEHQNASNADALTGAGEFCKKLMLVKIVQTKPTWLAVVRLVDPPSKAEMLRVHIGYLLRTSAFPSPIAPHSSSSAMTANLNIESSVPGADIEIDGAFVGNTPSTVTVATGSHQIAIKKKGFTDWSRTLNVTGGNVHLSAELENEQPMSN